MSVADKSMEAGLRALRRVAGMELLDRAGLRKPAERALFGATKNGFRAAGRANRAFVAANRLGKPSRTKPASSSGLFDLTPTEEQQMLQEAFGEFGEAQLRPAAQAADAACAAPAALLVQAAELGVTMLGVPEDLGGAVSERSAVTTVLAAEALARGDMGIAAAALAPAGVATALALWGDADQQSAYIPPFVSDDVPAGALAMQEPSPLFDPFALATKARRQGDGFVLDGVKSLVPRGAEAELFVVAAELEGTGPALFLVESGSKGVSVAAEPAIGARAAATAAVSFDAVALPAGALLGAGDPAVYAECVARARIAWAALAIGTAQAVLDYVIPYVKDRQAFGESIANRQSVAFAVADIGIELDGLRLTTYRAAARADLGKDFAREAALARRLTAERAVRIGSDGVQLLGGHGYVKEHPVERWYRDLRTAGVVEGALLV